MSGPNGEQCKDCYFFEAYAEWVSQIPIGQCRRHPPSMMSPSAYADEHVEFDFWQPDVYESTWCGEFKPMKEGE